MTEISTVTSESSNKNFKTVREVALDCALKTVGVALVPLAIILAVSLIDSYGAQLASWWDSAYSACSVAVTAAISFCTAFVTKYLRFQVETPRIMGVNVAFGCSLLTAAVASWCACVKSKIMSRSIAYTRLSATEKVCEFLCLNSVVVLVSLACFGNEALPLIQCVITTVAVFASGVRWMVILESVVLAPLAVIPGVLLLPQIWR